jgi:hypothetical protein
MPRLAPEDIIIRPILSEKSWREMEAGKYTFEVHPDATKPEIREAVEELFKVAGRERQGPWACAKWSKENATPATTARSA